MDLFPIKIRFAGWERFVLWSQSDIDTVLLGPTDRVLTFGTIEAAQHYVSDHGSSLEPIERNALNLDWIAEGRSFVDGEIDCVATLAAWNFFADVAASLPDKADDFQSKDRKPSKTYDKVFWGNNLPAVTPAGEWYEPAWSSEEIAEMEAILVTGLMLFCENLEEVLL